MPKKLTLSDFQEKLNQKYPNENLLAIEYNGQKHSCIIQCNDCKTVYHYSRSDKPLEKRKKFLCQQCMNFNKKKNAFIQSLKDSFPYDDLEVIEFSTSGNAKGKIKCNKCGHIYEYKRINTAFCKTKYFCNYCFPFNGGDRKDEAFKDFIINCSRWELAQEVPKDLNLTTNEIECKCTKCGKINKKTPFEYMKNYRCECMAFVQTEEDFKKKIGDEFELLTPYVNAEAPIMLRHSCGFIWKTTSHNFDKVGHCPACNRRTKQSKGEKKIQDFLIKNNISYIKEYPVEIEKRTLRFDFYLPGYDLFIEFQGEQHYRPVDFFGGEKAFNNLLIRDNLKRKYYNNILEIRYDEIDQINEILAKKLDIKFND